MDHLDPLALDAARAGEAHPHLEECAECRRAVESLRGLAERLRPATVEVPPEIDRAILAAAARPRLRARWWVPAAAAAALLVALTLRERAPGDVDGSGRVDILDAYLLALRIEGGAGAGRRFDVHGDGVVDRADVERIARLSVAVEGA
jgi:hypothetical protein